MHSLIKNRDYYGLGLSVLLLVLVVFQKIISPVIGLFIVIFLFELLVRKRLKFKFSAHLLWWIILFIIYGLSIFKATHQDIGLKLLEYKMSFFIFPIIFSFKSENFHFWKVIQGYLLGVLILLIGLTLMFLITGESYAIISSDYFHIHPSYSSAYISVALFIYFYGIYTKFYKVHFAVFLLVFLFSVITLFALISFAAILFLMLSVFIVVLVLIHKRFGLKGAAMTFLLGLTCVFLILSKSQRLSYDYHGSTQTIAQVFQAPKSFIKNNKDATSGIKIRMLMWMFSSEVIQDNPFGVGLGDIDFYLDEKVEKYDIAYLKKNHLNPHNQFLQVGIDLGLFGIIFFTAFFLLLIWYAFKVKNYILLFIILNLLFNCLFESMLQRQSGIIFYTLLITMSTVYTSKSDIIRINSKNHV